MNLSSAFLLSTFGRNTETISLPHHRREKKDSGLFYLLAILLKKKKLSAAFPNVSALLQYGVIPGVSPEPETIVGLY